MAKFAGLYLSGLALLSGVVCQACEEIFDNYGTHEIVAFVPPDNGGPATTTGTGTRLHRGSGR